MFGLPHISSTGHLRLEAHVTRSVYVAAYLTQVVLLVRSAYPSTNQPTNQRISTQRTTNLPWCVSLVVERWRLFKFRISKLIRCPCPRACRCVYALTQRRFFNWRLISATIKINLKLSQHWRPCSLDWNAVTNMYETFTLYFSGIKVKPIDIIQQLRKW